MKKTKKPSDISKYKNYKSAFQKLERHALETYVNNIIEPNENEDERQPKQKIFWSYIKSFRKDNSGISPLKDKGRLFISAKDKANILNKQYMSVFTKETDTNIPIRYTIPRNGHDRHQGRGHSQTTEKHKPKEGYSELDSFVSSTVPGHHRINIFVCPECQSIPIY